MPEIMITELEMQYIDLLQGMTGTTVKDCIIDKERNRVIFLVAEGQAGLAVGKNGIYVKSLRKLLKKDVEIIEYSESLEDLIRNSLFPAQVESVKLKKTPQGKKIVIVKVKPEHKGLAIGREGRTIARAKLVAKRYFDVDTVIIQ